MKFSKLPNDIILASASKRRKILMEAFGFKVSVVPSNINERAITSDKPRDLVEKISRAKAEAVGASYPDKTVIAADTIVYYKKMYGKPKDMDDAVRMLKELNGKKHYVYTGVTIAYGSYIYTFSDKSSVKFKKLNDQQILDYLRHVNPLDKAGAYAIQQGNIVEKRSGSFSNVMGLPMEKLSRYLTKAGVTDGGDSTIR